MKTDFERAVERAYNLRAEALHRASSYKGSGRWETALARKTFLDEAAAAHDQLIELWASQPTNMPRPLDVIHYNDKVYVLQNYDGVTAKYCYIQNWVSSKFFYRPLTRREMVVKENTALYQFIISFEEFEAAYSAYLEDYGKTT